jgi:hypothetical protein
MKIEKTRCIADLHLPLRFCYDRLSSLMKTLEITNTDDFLAIQMVADFGTLLGTYSRGFAVIIEPYDERLPHIPDPVLQLRYAASQVAVMIRFAPAVSAVSWIHLHLRHCVGTASNTCACVSCMPCSTSP